MLQIHLCVCMRVCMCVCVRACECVCMCVCVLMYCRHGWGSSLPVSWAQEEAWQDAFWLWALHLFKFSSTAEKLVQQRSQKVATHLHRVIKTPWNKTLKRTDFEEKFNIVLWENLSQVEKESALLQWYTAFPGRWLARMRSLASAAQKMTTAIPPTS